jgi:uncharacterized Fe-S cluster-containing MiaB family protein
MEEIAAEVGGEYFFEDDIEEITESIEDGLEEVDEKIRMIIINRYRTGFCWEHCLYG